LSYQTDPHAFKYIANSFGLNTADDLHTTLVRLKKPKQELIEIRDLKNHDRLLGTIPLSAVGGIEHLDHRCHQVNFIPHVHARARLYRDTEPCLDPVNVTTILFNKEWVGGHLEKRAVLVTSVDLELLLKWRVFRLPGETAAQVEERHWRY